MLYARAPRLGAVKTRLVPGLDPEEALEFHRALLMDSLRLLRRAAKDIGALPALALGDPERAGAPGRPAPSDPRGTALEEATAGLLLLPQRGADLGERLRDTFDGILRRRARPGAVVFGSDSPTLPMERLRSAFAILESGTEVVLGPAEDGGYYLIGATRPLPDLFAGIPWGTERVMEATLAAIERAGLRASLLPPWFDIDRPEDLARAYRDLEAAPDGTAERTFAFLRGLARAGRLAQEPARTGA